MSCTRTQTYSAFFWGAALLWSQTSNASDDHGRCYGYLTELVRSSSFPFSYVKKTRRTY